MAIPIINVSILNGSNGFRLDRHSGEYNIESVSTAGDFNGDGFDDVMVGASYFSRGASPNGASFVVFGKASGFNAATKLALLDGNDGFRFQNASRSLPYLVSEAGDVNSDGFDDVIIGARGFSDYYGNPQIIEANSYVVFGRSSGLDATMSLSDLDGSNGFRVDLEGTFVSVSSAGDVNGDGFDDVMIDADGTYVVFGKASGFEATMDLSNIDGSNGFRGAFSNAGDVNGDGFDDVMNGRYVVFGKASGFDATIDLSILDGSNGFRLDGVTAGDGSGSSVSSAGDVNGDGFDDLIVGASGADPNGFNSGSSYVVFGKASGFSAAMDLPSFASGFDSSNGFRLNGVAEGDGSGSSVSAAGDVNDDGFDDLIVGAPGADPHGRSSGSSYVIFGRSEFTDEEVDFPGTPGEDIFTGTSAAESFEGGEGNDRMIGRGGADSFDGGAGNDYIRILGADFQRVDGGSGTDILGVAGSGFNLDLSSVIDKIHGIEIISLYGVGDNTLTLKATHITDMSDETDTLKIKGNAGDSVTGLSSGWVDGGVHGNFHTYTQGEAVILVGVNVATDFPVI